MSIAKAARQVFGARASADLLNLDTFMHYEGIRQSDGSILAKKVEFQHAELEGGEAKMCGNSEKGRTILARQEPRRSPCTRELRPPPRATPAQLVGPALYPIFKKFL